MEIKFDKDPLAVEQNNYGTEIVNAHIVGDLDDWEKNSLNNFKFKNSWVYATNKVKKRKKEKWICNGYGIIFDRAGSRSFVNDYVRNGAVILVLMIITSYW